MIGHQPDSGTETFGSFAAGTIDEPFRGGFQDTIRESSVVDCAGKHQRASHRN
jgi:hypothetical protein